jgi:hypothetical protein
MGKAINLIIGIVIGIILSVVAFIFISVQFGSGPSKSLIKITEKNIQEAQVKIGMTCVEGENFVNRYIDAIPTSIGKLKNNGNINPTDSILIEGGKAREIVFECGMINRMAKSANIEYQVPPLLLDQQIETSIISFNTLLRQASAEWCEAKCIAHVLQHLTNMSNLTLKRDAEKRGAP